MAPVGSGVSVVMTTRHPANECRGVQAKGLSRNNRVNHLVLAVRWCSSTHRGSCGRDVQLGHLGVGDLDAFVVGVLVEPTLDGKTGLGRGAGDQLDDDLMGQHGLATPVLGDEGEQAVLDPTPLAGVNPPVNFPTSPEAKFPTPFPD